MSKEIIQQFYSAFQKLDAEAMAKLYHPDVEFEDPAFGKLNGEHAANMWRMLCTNQKDKGMVIEFEVTSAASAHWEPIYTFSKTGRKVHNKIDTLMEFKDGLIIKHIDDFNLHSWAKQALGFQGALIGWTGFFKKKLQGQTNHLLKKFESTL